MRERLCRALRVAWRVIDITRLVFEGLEHVFNAAATGLEGVNHWIEAALAVLEKKKEG